MGNPTIAEALVEASTIRRKIETMTAKNGEICSASWFYMVPVAGVFSAKWFMISGLALTWSEMVVCAGST